MKKFKEILERVIGRVNINLAEMEFDVGPYVLDMVEQEQFTKFYAFYGLSDRLPLHFHFTDSSLAGSYFLGKCRAGHSAIYKSDVRGDELKRRGDIVSRGDMSIPCLDDEWIDIQYSFLAKTLIHNFSHALAMPEEFFIHNTVAMPWSNIHGSPVAGCFIGALSTVDLTTVHDSVIGEFAYVQTGDLSHFYISPGSIWISDADRFNFRFRHDPDILRKYVSQQPGEVPTGIIPDFIESRKDRFAQVYDSMPGACILGAAKSSSINPYACVRGNCQFEDNVLVAQRAYLEDCRLGPGANAQEHCYIVNSGLAGLNVTAHGGKIINADLGEKVFVGFNSFVRGGGWGRLQIGDGSVVMPHTIIDTEERLTIPPGSLVWGFVAKESDLDTQSIPLSELAKVKDRIKVGGMDFAGDGQAFVEAFAHRIDHILEANGAFYNGTPDTVGHAQLSRNISFNTLQPYIEGDDRGVYPTIDIRP